ncbi:acyltransferase [Nocardia sp. CA2R105]|uniref:acyltransferase family protein n=1 Tax=Nocardia coffeae TaxID=2873381 RepID=UPI001CA6C6EA|nr:acyltransferase [Nocardia coffeae]MBY8855603.1 acyltransferase [Nocardia coffeae]
MTQVQSPPVDTPAADQRRHSGRLPSLTAARWWAACAVFAAHALILLPAYPFQKSELFRRIHQDFVPMQFGAAGVTFFFVLSGFIIYWSAGRGGSALGFYRRRVLKIYPTHLIAAAVFILAASVPLHRVVVWVPNLLLVHNWVPKWSTVGGLNVPSWSLCSEMLFYLSFPLLLPLVRRIPAARLLWWIAGLLIFVLALHAAYLIAFDGPTAIGNVFAPRLVDGDVSPHAELHAARIWFEQPDIPVLRSYWFSYNFPLSRLPEFYVGVLTARMVIENRWRNTRLTIPVLAVALSYLATWVVPVDFKMSATEVGPMAALIATMAVRDQRGPSARTPSRPMVWLGEISYAFYLIQFPIMVLVTRFLIGGHRFGLWGWLGCAGLCLLGSIVAAAAIYQLVDLPLMRRFARPRTRASAGSTPAGPNSPGSAPAGST